MSENSNLTNVAYAKANWVRYLLGGVLLALMIVITCIFIETIKNTRGAYEEFDETIVLKKDKTNKENENEYGAETTSHN